MKILQVITSLRTGGAEMLVVQMAALLNRRGHEVDIAVLDGESTPLMKQAEDAGIRVIALGNNAYNPLSVFKIARLLSSYDVVHTHNTAAQLFTAIASVFVLHCPKLVTAEHNTTNRRQGSAFWRLLDRWMYRQYARIICITDETKSNLLKHLGCLDERMSVINNGIDPEHFRNPSQITDVQMPKDKFNVIMVAGFRDQKDQDTLIKAMALLPADKFRLWLVGDGVRRAELESLIESENVSDRCTLLGNRTDVAALLQQADVAVMSSHYEGLSLSSVEGMAAGKPMVASDVPGLREVVGGAGILFPEGDSKQLAEIISRLSEDHDYYSLISAQCADRATKYDISIMVDKYEKLYQQTARV